MTPLWDHWALSWWSCPSNPIPSHPFHSRFLLCSVLIEPYFFPTHYFILSKSGQMNEELPIHYTPTWQSSISYSMVGSLNWSIKLKPVYDWMDCLKSAELPPLHFRSAVCLQGDLGMAYSWQTKNTGPNPCVSPEQKSGVWTFEFPILLSSISAKLTEKITFNMLRLFTWFLLLSSAMASPSSFKSSTFFGVSQLALQTRGGDVQEPTTLVDVEAILLKAGSNNQLVVIDFSEYH